MTPRRPASAPPKGPNTGLVSLSQNDVTTLAETFRLLGGPSWLKAMLCCMKGSTSVSDIAEVVKPPQSLVNHHLRLSRGVCLVKGACQSKQIFYGIADKHASQVLLDVTIHITEDNSDDQPWREIAPIASREAYPFGQTRCKSSATGT